MSEGENRTVTYCSFCGLADYEVLHLIKGPTALICNACIDTCNQQIHGQPLPQVLDQLKFGELLGKIDDPRLPTILKIYEEHKDLFHTNPGSSHNHQAWEGGLADHLADMLRLSWLEYRTLEALGANRNEELPFTLSSAQIAIFCHDAEKVVVYGNPDDPRCSRYFGSETAPSEKGTKERIKWDVLKHWRDHYGLELTEMEFQAVKYAHGEGADYRNDVRVMSEMAAFVGNIDRTSARILHDSGRDLG